MLYPTPHHHSLLSSSFAAAAHTTSLPPPPPASLQAVMECVELGVMKVFFKPEAALKMIQEHGDLENEFSAAAAAGNGQGGISGDEFSVDELLDFSNGFVEEEEEGNKNSSVTIVSVSPQNPEAVTFPVADDFPGSEISVPADNLDSEWLSHFVEDSFSGGYSLTLPAGKLLPTPSENNRLSGYEIPVQRKPGFTTPVQTKARTKRARTGVRVWPVGSPSLTESSTSSSSSSSSTTTFSSSPPSRFFVRSCSSQIVGAPIGKPPAKKPKNSGMISNSGGGAQPQSRRCSHCGVQKTPQWRAGPLGAKTLCNACGVRFKSGRLLPEYRPACSPTFSHELHSNSHRKVLEMRRKKEEEDEEETGPGLASPVQSF